MEENEQKNQKFDMACPMCGTINHDLYLNETDGWMECEHCHSVVKSIDKTKPQKRIPVYRMEDAAKVLCQSSAK